MSIFRLCLWMCTCVVRFEMARVHCAAAGAVSQKWNFKQGFWHSQPIPALFDHHKLGQNCNDNCKIKLKTMKMIKKTELMAHLPAVQVDHHKWGTLNGNLQPANGDKVGEYDALLSPAYGNFCLHTLWWFNYKQWQIGGVMMLWSPPCLCFGMIFCGKPKNNVFHDMLKFALNCAYISVLG